MEQWRKDYNAAMGAARAAQAAGDYNAAINYASQAASQAGTSAAATAATNLRQGIYEQAGPGYGPGATMGQPTGGGQPGPAAPPGPSAEDIYWANRAAREEAERQAQQNRLIEITRDYFRANGMEAFITGMEKYVRAGYSGDEIMVMLKNDADYKAAWDKRFAGNAARVKAGLTELLPASYIALEQSYKQLMLRYGAPATLFDNPEDFADLIGKDVSALELNDRLGEASAYVNYSGNAEVKRQLREIYGLTDEEMFAYVLDPTRTSEYLASESRRNLNRANVGGAAVTAGVKLANEFRDEIASMYDAAGTSNAFDNAIGRFGQVAQESPLYQRLGALSSETATADELVREQFEMAGAADVTNKKKALASQERARFSGQSGLGSTSLSAGRRAQ